MAFKDKEREKAYKAAWYQENKEREYALYKIRYTKDPEKFKARNDEYILNNKEKVMSRRKTYRKTNSERIVKHVMNWQAENKERVRGYKRKWRENNPDKQKECIANWNKAHPESERIKASNRRSLKKYNGGRLSPGIAKTLMERQRGRCAICAKSSLKKTGYNIDHIIPLVLGGKNDDRNVQVTCPDCNNQKGGKHPVTFMQSMGFLL